MDDKMRNVIKSAIREFERLSYISPEDIPEIPLYMDQITTFMDAKLAACKRHPEDKIFTKTMINNYTKNKLIPPPDKKKYSRDHLLSLIYVYYLKDFLQISDIKTLLSALNETPFAHREEEAMQSIYDAVFHLDEGPAEEMEDGQGGLLRDRRGREKRCGRRRVPESLRICLPPQLRRLCEEKAD